MRPRAIAFFLALLMAWMAMAAQAQAATVSASALIESVQPSEFASDADDSAPHLDTLPVQLLADFLVLLRPLAFDAASAAAPRPGVLVARTWPNLWLDGPDRPPRHG
jgi:hypothetical protein